MSVTPESSLPERITPDAILEALVEFRFEHAEMSELVLGRLLDMSFWGSYIQTRLPTADIPQPIREMDPNLRYQPLVELRRRDGNRVAKIGSHVVSYHISGPYPGWAAFRSEIDTALHEVIAKLRSAQFSRIGFRYINALRPDEHHIRGLADTNIVLKVGSEVLTDSVNINYNRSFGSNHVVTVKIATPDLVAGDIRQGYSLLCDIDVGSKIDGFIASHADAMAWIEEAHTREKSEFFAILPEDLTNKLANNGESGNG